MGASLDRNAAERRPIIGISPGRMKPPSFSELSVIGCALMLVLLGLAGLALYVCIRTGFSNHEAISILVFCLMAFVGLLLAANWVNRQF